MGLKILQPPANLQEAPSVVFLLLQKLSYPAGAGRFLGCLGTPNEVVVMGMSGGCWYGVSASLLGLVALPHSGVGVGMLWGDAGDASMVLSTSTLAAASFSTPWPKLRCGGLKSSCNHVAGKTLFLITRPMVGFRHPVPLEPLLRFGEPRHPEERGELLPLGHQCSERGSVVSVIPRTVSPPEPEGPWGAPAPPSPVLCRGGTAGGPQAVAAWPG